MECPWSWTNMCMFCLVVFFFITWVCVCVCGLLDPSRVDSRPIFIDVRWCSSVFVFYIFHKKLGLLVFTIVCVLGLSPWASRSGLISTKNRQWLESKMQSYVFYVPNVPRTEFSQKAITHTFRLFCLAKGQPGICECEVYIFEQSVFSEWDALNIAVSIFKQYACAVLL